MFGGYSDSYRAKELMELMIKKSYPSGALRKARIDMLLDEGEVHLRAGDVVVQQATNHAWVNRGKEICRIAFILMDSQEP